MKTGLTRAGALFTAGLLACGAPLSAFAHEVYVLSADQIADALSVVARNPFAAIRSSETLFISWSVGIVVLLIVVFRVSISRKLEHAFADTLSSWKTYAPILARVTLGLALLLSGVAASLFGPELSLDVLFGAAHPFVRFLLMFFGVMLLAGCLTRTSAFITMLLYAYALLCVGFYLLNYLGFFGLAFLLFAQGSGKYSVEHFVTGLVRERHAYFRRLAPYGFAAFRVSLGLSIVSASFYAKFLHSTLAFTTVETYRLTDYFPFTPDFLVLGAFLVELLVGVLFIVGFELRFISLVFLGFLFASLCFFGEAIWPHIILIGGSAAIFLNGYDAYALELKLLGKRIRRNMQPIF